jgi:hypothetical protein
MTEPSSEPTGQTPSAPDVDQPEGGTGDAGRTPGNPDNDQPDGGDDA